MKFRFSYLKIIMGVCLVLQTNFSFGSSILADVNDEAFKFEYKTSNYEYGYNASILAHEDDGAIYALGAQVQGNTLQNESINGALGGKLYYIDLDNNISGFAIGLGGSVNLDIHSLEGFSVEIDAYYAPGVISFSDIDHHTDISIRGLYQILNNGSVYVGYRKAHIDATGGISGNLDSGLHLGLKLDF